jgi:hypothetical protein
MIRNFMLLGKKERMLAVFSSFLLFRSSNDKFATFDKHNPVQLIVRYQTGYLRMR